MKTQISAALITAAVFLLPGVSQARMYNANTGRFQTMDTYDGNQEEPQTLHRYTYCVDNPVNRVDPSGHESYVGFDTVGWNNYGHVGIITHNPSTGIYTEFDHAHGIVYQRQSQNAQAALAKTDNYGMVFIIPSQYDSALDTARQAYKKHPGGSTLENNCLTSVLDIFNAAQVPYPKGSSGIDPLFPNNWLGDFWNANYGYKLLQARAGQWIQRVLIRQDTLGLGVVPGTGMMYVTF